MKKPDKKEMINLFFSAFLILAFIVCAHFFNDFTQTLPTVAGSIVSALVYVVFGLLLFYATRVGDGKAIKRFSPVTLIVLVLPTLYIVVASIAAGMPLHDIFVTETGSSTIIVVLAAVALGYGVPYTFLSGYEVADEEAEAELNDKPLEGGIEADLLDENKPEQTEANIAEEVVEPSEPIESDNSEADDNVEKTSTEESTEA